MFQNDLAGVCRASFPVTGTTIGQIPFGINPIGYTLGSQLGYGLGGQVPFATVGNQVPFAVSNQVPFTFGNQVPFTFGSQLPFHLSTPMAYGIANPALHTYSQLCNAYLQAGFPNVNYGLNPITVGSWINPMGFQPLGWR
jgi:hypothetical protein